MLLFWGDMLKLQYDRSQQAMIAYNDDNSKIKSWECHDDFVEGFNDSGDPHESLPNGFYPHAWAEDHDTAMANGIAYGSFYIHTGDPRGRDIHGGGSSCEDPYADRQGWFPTYGCLRMQNEDGIELSNLMMENGNDIGLEVTNG